MKFKVGNRVKHKGGEYEGVVTDLSSHTGEQGDFIRIKRSDGKDGSGVGTGKWAVQPENIELVHEPLRLRIED